jgi:hypothetical protein
MTEFFQNGEIDNEITDRDAHARFTFFQLENTEWKILNRKMRNRRNVDERAKKHVYDLTTKITEDTKSFHSFRRRNTGILPVPSSGHLDWSRRAGWEACSTRQAGSLSYGCVPLR